MLVVPSDLGVDLESFITEYERANHLVLSEDQRRAVEALSQHRVLVLTGLPGTGKTTTIRALVRFFEAAQQSFALMAPTGIAAKRLAAVAGHQAMTIHRALHYDGDVWGYCGDNRYIVDAVIVDETSMVDQELLYRLLGALRPETMLVLVGDDAQLPSVGPGNVLRELVGCPDIPSVRLTKIFRQSEKGEIVLNSHRIDRGEMPELLDPRGRTEFKFLRMSDEERIVDVIVKIAAILKAGNANFQVLGVKYAGTVGVDNLNSRLRDRLNPKGPSEWQRGNQHFRLGDRLMVVRNDYQLRVYNGDMGKLIRIGEKHLLVKIHGIGKRDPDTQVSFAYDVAEEKLRLAYAVTVHKSQGSEFDTIILPIVRSQGRMLQRNLLYTAVTRARKQVWLVGEEEAIRRAVANNQVVCRNTALAEALSACVGVGVDRGHNG
jgi:exodeoxyribonuclease V alpha subunit